MTTPDAGPAASALDGIRERAATLLPMYPDSRYMIDALVQDVPGLVAAVEAALKLHQPGRVTILGALCKRHESHRFFSITSTEADAVRACPDCAATVYRSCTGCGPGVSVDACVTRNDITAALAGKEAGDAGIR